VVLAELRQRDELETVVTLCGQKFINSGKTYKPKISNTKLKDDDF
jgi:hypothetical protein